MIVATACRNVIEEERIAGDVVGMGDAQGHRIERRTTKDVVITDVNIRPSRRAGIKFRVDAGRENATNDIVKDLNVIHHLGL